MQQDLDAGFERQTFSLFELNEHLRRVLTFNMREPVWIKAELTEGSRSKGTVYLSLVERADQSYKAKAEAILWGKTYAKLEKKLGASVLELLLQPGRVLLLEVKVSFHSYYGLKLEIEDIDSDALVGQLELQRNKALETLRAGNFLDLNRQQKCPKVLQRIAVISSNGAAGLQDFYAQLEANPNGYKYDWTLFSAVVQGTYVKDEVCKRLEEITEKAASFDAVVIVRGGGARLDLMGFDDPDLCKAIAKMPLPVFTGIGHEIDETLADLVAYASFKTPTAVAEYLIYHNESYELALARKVEQIKQIAQRRLQEAAHQLTRYKEQLTAQTKFSLKQEQLKLQ
jgi:exodeoxyribonuclease VII large subunit